MPCSNHPNLYSLIVTSIVISALLVFATVGSITSFSSELPSHITTLTSLEVVSQLIWLAVLILPLFLCIKSVNLRLNTKIWRILAYVSSISASILTIFTTSLNTTASGSSAAYTWLTITIITVALMTASYLCAVGKYLQTRQTPLPESHDASMELDEVSTISAAVSSEPEQAQHHNHHIRTYEDDFFADFSSYYHM